MKKDRDYILNLRDKIETLENIVNLKCGEINLYKEVLKDIGAQLEYKKSQALIYDSPNFIDIETTRIYLNRTLASKLELETKLNMINDTLEHYDELQISLREGECV